jgi:hypothetical protein
VQLFLSLLPQAQAESPEGTTFSTAALSQTHFKAGWAPQEQVDFLAQTQSEAEQTILYYIIIISIVS